MGSGTRKRLLSLGIGVLVYCLAQADSPALDRWNAKLAQALLQRTWSEAVPAARADCPGRPGARACLVARLSIPAQHAARIVSSQSSNRAPAGGWGHLAGTPLPGATGNAVLQIYAPADGVLLQRLRRGDTLVVELPDARQFAFRVTDARLTDWRAIRVERETRGPELTLISHDPGDVRGERRLVVNAALLPVPLEAGISPVPIPPIARRSTAAPPA